MKRTITAFFDSRSDAQAAADKLRHIGLTSEDVSIHDQSSARTTTTAETEDKGFFASLSDFFLPDEDRYAYEEGMRRGGSVVTVRADDADFDTVSDILEESGSVDLDTRESEWRSEGWSGETVGDRTATGTDAFATTGSTAAGGATASLAGRGGGTAGSTASAYGTGRETGVGTGTARATDFGTGAGVEDRDGTIDVIEENLRVGKRDVGHGRVRVRSYVREEPVSEDVSLRSERVEIERRPVDRPVEAGDAAFRDRTLELEERAEEAVVSKEARVKEEIDLRKVGSERTETVSDTVRRTEVDVEDERRGRSLTEDEVRRQGERKL
ncbi:YsnF/AvaK domain-containing protein [Aureimonas leprariae]|uniref:DUF2382 domain-containing protein n=1 Tax=Plantimonas leprariae TaxID=2615207 RepID=A0A7V7PSY3_9HYPH|nr:YsnF/AvaK domain-containing protein [Aureimonas leprariae]KAB0682750.1 DUF2382 domain-containing protein [Aureimonas leprariae]